MTGGMDIDTKEYRATDADAGDCPSIYPVLLSSHPAILKLRSYRSSICRSFASALLISVEYFFSSFL